MKKFMSQIRKWKKIRTIAFTVSFHVRPTAGINYFFPDLHNMDLLGSILGSMDASKPPPPSEKEKVMKKKRKELAAKLEEKHKEAKLKFRTKVETQINDFLKKENEKTLKFSAMDKYHRSVIHDVVEIAGLVTYSFGEEDEDRHIQVGKCCTLQLNSRF